MIEVTIEYQTVRGDKDFSERVAPDRLLESIDDIRRRFQDGLNGPYGVDVVNDEGDRMTIGYDEREGFLMLQPSDQTKWTSYSFGDPKREDSRVFFLPVHSELSGKYMVPTSRLRKAVRRWAENGELSDDIGWTTQVY